MATHRVRACSGLEEPIDSSVSPLSMRSILFIQKSATFFFFFTERFSPWQLVVSTLTGVYAIRNLDKIVGLGCEPTLPETTILAC